MNPSKEEKNKIKKFKQHYRKENIKVFYENKTPNLIQRFLCWFKKRDDKYCEDLFELFIVFVKEPISKKGLVNLICRKPIKDLIYLQLKCKKEDGIVEPASVLQFLDNEINRRIQSRIIFVSLIAVVISIFVLIFNYINDC